LFRKWWFKKHRPFQPLFVIATCRSGSNLLLSHLGQQPGVHMLGEVLCHVVPSGPRRRCLPPERAVSHIRRCLQAEKTQVRGCKLMLYQLADCGLTLDDLHSAFPEAKYVILYRQSMAEQFVSERLAWATRQYVLRPGDEPRRVELTINPDELRRYCNEMRSDYRHVLSHSWLAGRAVLLSYEELVADARTWLKDHICPLLNVPPVMARTHLLKQNTLPLAQQVTNYRETAALLHSPLCKQYHVWPWQRHDLHRAA
jgi:LPS sulfotransferase NodH